MIAVLRNNFAFVFGAAIVVAVVMLIVGIVRADRAASPARGRIIADVYNSGTGQLDAYVYATNAHHRFPNGTVGEGWLMLIVNVPDAYPMWFVKPKKAKVVWR